jgi:hypothetical protein
MRSGWGRDVEGISEFEQTCNDLDLNTRKLIVLLDWNFCQALTVIEM